MRKCNTRYLIRVCTYPRRKFCGLFPEFPPTACLCLSAQRTGSRAIVSTVSYMTVRAVKRLITPCQVKGRFILTTRCRIDGLGGESHYLFKGTVTGWVAWGGGLRSRNPLHNKSIWSNINAADGGQGFIETAIISWFHRVPGREAAEWEERLRMFNLSDEQQVKLYRFVCEN